MSKFSDAVNKFKISNPFYRLYMESYWFVALMDENEDALDVLNGIPELYDDIQSLKTKLHSLNDKVVNQQETISELQVLDEIANQQKIFSELESLKTTIDNQQKIISELQSFKDVAANQQKTISELRYLIKTIQEQNIYELQHIVTDQQKTVSELQANQQKTISDLQSLKDETINQQKTISALQNQIQGLKTSTDPLATALVQTEIGKSLYEHISKSKLRNEISICKHLEQIKDVLKPEKIDSGLEESLKNAIQSLFDELFSIGSFRQRLQILFEYEELYLELIRKYKDEIIFSNCVQEDIRRERSIFFTQTLKEVEETLKKTHVDNQVISKWIQELVDSYTKSLDLSCDLAKTHFTDMVDKIREELKKHVDAIKTQEQPAGEKDVIIQTNP